MSTHSVTNSSTSALISHNPAEMPKTETLARSQPQPDFPLALTRVAVAQICQSAGFASANSSALRTLTTVAALYIRAIAALAASRANRSSRTQSNLHDVIAALEDLHAARGFPGQSDVSAPLLRSCLMVQIMDFVNFVDEVPFAQPIRRSNPVRNPRISTTEFLQEEDRAHIPMWLPPMPDPSTYLEAGEGCGVRRNGEVLFPNGSCEEASVSGTEMVETWRKQECGRKRRYDLSSRRCRVKFEFGVKRKKNGLEVGVDLRGKGVCIGREKHGSRDETDQTGKEEEEEERVYGRKGSLLNNPEKRVVYVRRRKCG